jgi:hypothetical protein
LIVRQLGNDGIQLVDEQNDQPVGTIALIKERFGSVQVRQEILIVSTRFTMRPWMRFDLLYNQVVDGLEEQGWRDAVKSLNIQESRERPEGTQITGLHVLCELHEQ